MFKNQTIHRVNWSVTPHSINPSYVVMSYPPSSAVADQLKFNYCPKDGHGGSKNRTKEVEGFFLSLLYFPCYQHPYPHDQTGVRNG